MKVILYITWISADGARHTDARIYEGTREQVAELVFEYQSAHNSQTSYRIEEFHP